jgi:serine/threonine-protein kinase
MPFVGSPHYMSPEQIRSSRDVDMRSDVWSIGIILYEFLTGRPPFRADEVGGVLAAVLTERAKPLRDHRPELPAELDRIVLACLEKDVDRRTKSVADVGAALAPFGSADARLSLARIRGISGGAAPPVSARRWRLVAPFAAAGAVLALSVAGVMVARRSPPAAIAPERPLAPSAVPGGAVAAPVQKATTPPSTEAPLPARVSESGTATTGKRESIETRKRAVPATRRGAAARQPSPPSEAGPEKRRRRDIDALFEERR